MATGEKEDLRPFQAFQDIEALQLLCRSLPTGKVVPMICNIRFLAKSGKYDKAIAKHDRECVSVEEALRWAAAALKKSTPEEQSQVTSVRVRVVAL